MVTVRRAEEPSRTVLHAYSGDTRQRRFVDVPRGGNVRKAAKRLVTQVLSGRAKRR
jgi:hypothetical protein